eukprot:scaffold35848_cov157-Isochrysis_galbana.AAC.1
MAFAPRALERRSRLRAFAAFERMRRHREGAVHGRSPRAAGPVARQRGWWPEWRGWRVAAALRP